MGGTRGGFAPIEACAAYLTRSGRTSTALRQYSERAPELANAWAGRRIQSKRSIDQLDQGDR
jgi:hypothetical protein